MSSNVFDIQTKEIIETRESGNRDGSSNTTEMVGFLLIQNAEIKTRMSSIEDRLIDICNTVSYIHAKSRRQRKKSQWLVSIFAILTIFMNLYLLHTVLDERPVYGESEWRSFSHSMDTLRSGNHSVSNSYSNLQK